MLYLVPDIPEDDGRLARAEELINQIYRITQEDCMYAMLLADIQHRIEVWKSAE